MIRDRGNIKWTAMMLPEHVKAVRDWLETDGHIERPNLDDWELESIQMEIELAYKRQRAVSVTTWRKGKEFVYSGKIAELDQRLHFISIEGPFGDSRIPVGDVTKAECLDW